MVTIFPPLFSRAWKGTRGTRNDENRTRGGGQSKPRGACNRGGVATQHIVGELDEVKEKKKEKTGAVHNTSAVSWRNTCAGCACNQTPRMEFVNLRMEGVRARTIT